MNVFKLAGKFEKVSNIDLPISSLYLLAAPSTPPEDRYGAEAVSYAVLEDAP